ncbi:hypothetical protein HC028_07865 [Planosporangium flavigriseum]|uniref:Uncharacterized protein n=1 Tax=Planosporangium flavigriseum TaxID=373681 RepID=A0A8J3LQE8_9ACTN|nr:hypothetical protein [Planosporangium flavigriseum]NJC64425.1 hypothetical protein [Planosporangium flavigriseum]GIG72099.1 hypothetical protein Pfl04_05030 [Planosporangium flavigriseum]
MDVTTSYAVLSGVGMLAFSIGAFGVLDAYHKRNAHQKRVDWLISLYVVGVLLTVVGFVLYGRWWMAAPFALLLLPADRAMRMRLEIRQRRAHLKRLKGSEEQ